jgi:O-antigen ligase
VATEMLNRVIQITNLPSTAPTHENRKIGSKSSLGLLTFFFVLLAFYPQAPRYFVSTFADVDINFQFLSLACVAGFAALLVYQSKLTGFFIPMVILLCMLGLLSITAFNTSSTVYFQEKIQKTWTVIPLFYFVGLVIGRAKLNVLAVLQIVFWFCFAVTILANYISLDVVSSYVDRDLRAESDTFGYQLISRIAGIGAAIAFCLALFGKDQNIVTRFLSLACALYLLNTVTESGGRTGLLVVLIAISVFMFRQWPRAMIAGAAIFGIAFLVLGSSMFSESINGLASDSRMPATLRRLFFYLQSDVDLRDRISRDLLHGYAKTLFLEQPIFGVGYGNFPVAAGIGDILGKYPHNLYLELLSETGVFGGAVFAFWLCFVFGKQSLYQLLLEKNRVLLISIAVFFGVAMVTSDIVGQRELFFLLGMATVLRETNQISSREKND